MKQNQSGYVYTLQAFIVWGLLPLYWKQLKALPAFEVLMHRIWWSLVFILLILLIQKRAHLLPLLRSRKTLLTLTITALLVGSNWGLYIYAVNANFLVEASLGYYITPLVNIALGMIILRERLDRLKLLALLFALIGVLYLSIDFGQVPWIALYLAFSFGLYGLLKKTSGIEPLPALAIETLIIAPIAFIWIIWGYFSGEGALFRVSIKLDLLLIVAGVATTMPLYWFAQGARKIPLSSVGFMQYIAPTIMLFLGIFIYNEAFPIGKIIAFSFIWLALLIYTLSVFRNKPVGQ
jgi:chloramphenicol-sensitive protein RarD